MSVLDTNTQVSILSALMEGASIRGTERMFSTHRNTVTLDGAGGRGCCALHGQPNANASLQIVTIRRALDLCRKEAAPPFAVG